MRFHGGRHWPLILCFACLVRAKGIGFGVMEDFGGGVTEYSWGYLAYCALNIYLSSLWTSLPYDAYVSQHICREGAPPPPSCLSKPACPSGLALTMLPGPTTHGDHCLSQKQPPHLPSVQCLYAELTCTLSSARPLPRPRTHGHGGEGSRESSLCVWAKSFSVRVATCVTDLGYVALPF